MTRCRSCELPVLTVTDGMCTPCRVGRVVRRDQARWASAIAACEASGTCAYCGAPASERDHIVPRKYGLPSWAVPSCRSCNGTAHAAFTLTLAERRALIRKRLARRNARLLWVSEFSERELDELGANLARHIAEADQAARLLRARLRHEVEP